MKNQKLIFNVGGIVKEISLTKEFESKLLGAAFHGKSHIIEDGFCIDIQKHNRRCICCGGPADVDH